MIYLMKLPVSVVKVGGFDFAIEYMNLHEAAASRRYGECSTIEQLLRFQQEMPSRFKAVDTVLHEIFHAIYWTFGIEDEDKEERIVSALGSAMMQVHRDNPWLAVWINETLHGEHNVK